MLGDEVKMTPKLSSCKVFVRLRPKVYGSGCGHDQDDGIGYEVAKSLEAFTQDSITLKTQYMFSDGHNRYDFPTKVFPPEVSQVEVFQSILPQLCKRLLTEDVLLLAYGQTGTGKTHTIFGQEGSFENCGEESGIREGWGILPRLVHYLFDMCEHKQDEAFILTLSAIELYMGGAFDLLTNQTPTMIHPDIGPIGHSHVVLESPGHAMEVIKKILHHRTTRGTLMNQRTSEVPQDEASGSSRSHCGVMLHLLRVQTKECSGMAEPVVTGTTIHVVDLSGAERPKKVGTGDVALTESGAMAYWKATTGRGEITAQEEGLVINYELFEFCREVKLATLLHKKRKPYSPPKQNATGLSKYLGHCLDGRASLSMIVCLSQAPQCGWETWFSLQYGKDLASLKAPVRKADTKPLQTALDQAESRATSTRKDLSKSKVGSKYRWRREVAHTEAKERLRLLQLLASKFSAIN